MSYKNRYEKRRKILLNDKTICKTNRLLFKQFFDFEEVKLRRINGFSSVDERSYKTLNNYIVRFRNVNNWFKNKSWKQLTKKDIEKVFNDLEDGIIKNANGNPWKSLNKSYYASIFKSKPFEMAGKKEICKEVMEFFNKKAEEQVRFIDEETFRKLVDVAITAKQKCLLWLGWDIGENIGSLILLKKKNFLIQENKNTNEKEYRINLTKEILKRSRTPRSEITNYSETVSFLDTILKNMNEEDRPFDFGIKQAQKVIRRAAEIVNATCIPGGERVTWKDLRSSMACHLLKIGWSRDEINARLGHKPSSCVLDRYINFLAIDRAVPKQKVHNSNLEKLRLEIGKYREIEKLQSQRIEGLKIDKEVSEERMEALESKLKEIEKFKIMAENTLSFLARDKEDIKTIGKTTSKNKYIKPIIKA